MREKLKQIYNKGNERQLFRATFKRFGTRSGYKGIIKTILLINVVDASTYIVADHIWMDCGKTFDKLSLIEGDKIQFNARVKIYKKGYEGFNEFGDEGFATFDYGLCYPSKSSKIRKYMISDVENMIEIEDLTI